MRKPQFEEAVLLTDLLTRPCGTRETRRETGDSHRSHVLVSETHGYT
jgi:hypothetical protein